MLCSPHARSLVGAVLLAAVIAAAGVGCDAEVGQPAPKKPALSGPEESFNRILARIKMRLEQGPQQSFTSGGLDPNTEELSHFSYEDKVSGEVFPPNEDGDPYTARVVITTHALFIHTRTPSTPEKPDQSPPSDNDTIGSILEGEASDFPLGEDTLVPDGLDLLADESEEPTPPTPSGGTRSKPAEKETMDVYELVHEGGRWVLQTEVDKESMKLIFDDALMAQ